MDKEQIQQERLDLLSQINEILDFPLILLSIVWLILIIVDFVYGLSSRLQTASTVIWGIFIADFLLNCILLRKKGLFKGKLACCSFSLPSCSEDIKIIPRFQAI